MYMGSEVRGLLSNHCFHGDLWLRMPCVYMLCSAKRAQDAVTGPFHLFLHVFGLMGRSHLLLTTTAGYIKCTGHLATRVLTAQGPKVSLGPIDGRKKIHSGLAGDTHRAEST